MSGTDPSTNQSNAQNDNITIDALVDSYVDGAMSKTERAAFEVRLNSDPAVAKKVADAKSLDDRLRKAFAYIQREGYNLKDIILQSESTSPLKINGRPVVVVKDHNSAPNIADNDQETHEESPPSHTRRRVLYAIAASLAVAATYSLWPREELNIISPDEVYRRFVATGWRPSFTCENDDQFIAAVQKRLGRAVLISTSTVGVVLNGWGYAEGYSGTPVGSSTMYLLTHAEGKPVLVLMERASRDREVTLSDSGKNVLHLFRRKVGGVVLYEVTPWPNERVISAAVAK